MIDQPCRKRFWGRTFWIQLAVALGVGALAGWISYDKFADYAALLQPPFAPPAWVFPVVWTVLYVLMAVSITLVLLSPYDGCHPTHRRTACWLYGAQLFFNFFWTMFFFTLQWRLFAFFWLLALLVLVVLMIDAFRRLNHAAAWLQIPYLLWLLFAAYLNLGVYLLNA